MIANIARNAIDGGSQGSDPDFSKVSLLLHMDGANGSTTFTDSSSNAFSVTTTGSPTISTTQSQFGGASASFSGPTDRLNVASNAAFALGTGDFTVEFWVYFNSITTTQTGFINVPVSGGFSFYWSGSAGYFGVSNSLVVSNRSANQSVRTWSPVANTWYHIAITRSGTSLDIWVNGSKLGATATNSTNFAQSSLQIGGTTDGTGWTHNGYMDEIRITNGVARYTSTFTPTGPFPNS